MCWHLDLTDTTTAAAAAPTTTTTTTTKASGPKPFLACPGWVVCVFVSPAPLGLVAPAFPLQGFRVRPPFRTPSSCDWTASCAVVYESLG